MHRDPEAGGTHKTLYERKQVRTEFSHHNKSICQHTFNFLHGISASRFKRLKSHYITHGRTHGNTKRLPKHALSSEQLKEVVTYIQNHAEAHALVLPGRIPGYKQTDIKLLPCSTTKHEIWELYRDACGTNNTTCVAYSTFTYLWRSLTPSIVVMKPASDLCWVCQQQGAAVLKAANMPEGAKSDVLRKYEEHLRVVGIERSFYKTTSDNVKKTLTQYFLSHRNESKNGAPCSRDILVNYSFDMAQQVHYPNDPLQPGPIYFLTPRKCGIFGVCCEAIPRQINYLVDESVDIGKGSNSIISKLHHFFHTFGLGEQRVTLHADNCSGQNKNNMMLQYLMWRCMVGLHKEIAFLVVGHTKFAPDWCFGLLKRKFRREKVGCLADIARVVDTSATVNISQLCGTQTGEVLVPTHDWKAYLSQFFKTLRNIKSYHHFRFSSATPGSVFVKEYADTEEHQTLLLNDFSWQPTQSQLPPIIHPLGLSLDRQWYLYDSIRQFCPESVRDEVCPKPTFPKGSHARHSSAKRRKT